MYPEYLIHPEVACCDKYKQIGYDEETGFFYTPKFTDSRYMGENSSDYIQITYCPYCRKPLKPSKKTLRKAKLELKKEKLVEDFRRFIELKATAISN